MKNHFLNKIILRQYTLPDAVELARLFQHPEIQKNSKGKVSKYSLKDAEKHIRLRQLEYRQKKSARMDLAIEHRGKLIGGIKYTLDGREAEIGYWLGRPYWGQGIMTQVIQGLVKDLKKKHKIIRVEAKIFSFNAASGRVLEKAGFKREALIVRDAKVGKKYYDQILYGQVI